jgi:ankyrin repeat protein
MPELYNWFYTGLSLPITPTTPGEPPANIFATQGTADFFKARGEQNYKGQTIEHVACLTRMKNGQEEDQAMAIVEAIKPRPDIKDYFGNLPLFYALQENDTQMVQRLFKKGRDYFNIRNYKNESIFHVAAKSGSTDSIRILIDGITFTEELLKKDYLGNTPLHYAGRKGNLAILEFFVNEGGEPTKLMLDL